MKKIILLGSLIVIGLTTSYAQDVSGTPKVYRNEFGIDISGFVRQFVNSNTMSPYSYSSYAPIYYLTYRRHFKSSNLRFAIGGDYSNSPKYSYDPSDTKKYDDIRTDIDVRIGWEFFNNLAPRWDVFYGLDLKAGYTLERMDATYWNGGYANGRESITSSWAVSPLIGFRYKLTKRLSLLTEASLALVWQENKSKRYYTPTSTQFPSKAVEILPRTKTIFTNYEQPFSIHLTFDI